LSSRITFEMACSYAGDIMVVCVTPSLGGTTPTSTAVAMGQQFTKTKLIQMGQPASSCRIINKMSEAVITGVPKKAIEYDLSGNTIGNYTAQPADVNYWVVNFNRDDGAVTTGVTGWRCVLEHEVEYFGDGNAIEPETAMANFQPLSHSAVSVEAATAVCPTSGTPLSTKLLTAYKTALAKEALREQSDKSGW